MVAYVVAYYTAQTPYDERKLSQIFQKVVLGTFSDDQSPDRLFQLCWLHVRPAGNDCARAADNDDAEDGDDVINSIDSISAYAISEICGMAIGK